MILKLIKLTTKLRECFDGFGRVEMVNVSRLIVQICTAKVDGNVG